jgi:hypothetical protein
MKCLKRLSVRKQCLVHVFFSGRKFFNGRESVEDELRSGRPVKVKTDENIKRTEEQV